MSEITHTWKCEVIMADGKLCGIGTSVSIGNKPVCYWHGAGHVSSKEFKEKIFEKLKYENENPANKVIDFTEFDFPDINFDGFHFKKSVIFKGARFSSGIDFSKCKFSGNEVDFSGTLFGGERVDFTKCEFYSNSVSFLNSVLDSKSIHFHGAKFNSKILSFYAAKFHGEVSFGGCEFELTEFITFGSAEFKGSSIDFSGSFFRVNECDFSYTVCQSNFYLTFSEFDAESLTFEEAIFGKEITDFEETVFNVKFISFKHAQFNNKELNFTKTMFNGSSVSFENSYLGSVATLFIKTQFVVGNLEFIRTWFAGEHTLFHDTKFHCEKTLFDNSVVEKDLDFVSTPKLCEQDMFPHPVSMAYLMIKNSLKIKFMHVDLSKVSFRGTELQQARFIDVRWYKMKLFRLWIKPFKFRNAIFDEPIIREKAKHLGFTRKDFSKADIELVRHFYQQLKHNYEENRNYDEANDFYFGEMEMSRRKKKTWLEKNLFSWEALYRIVSGYGQLWENTLFILLTSLIVFPILYLFSGIVILGNSSTINYELAWNFPPFQTLLNDFKECFNFSTWNLAFFRDMHLVFKPSPATRYIQILQLIVSPALITLFILALKRKFKR